VRLLPVLTDQYFDDFPLLNLSSGKDAHGLLKSFAKMLGYSFSVPKSREMAAKREFLGVLHDVSQFGIDGTVSCTAKPDRVELIAVGIGKIREAGSFAGTMAADRLVGKLDFTLQWAAGRFGKAAIQPLTRRASGHVPDGQPLSPAEQAALAFFLAFLGSQMRCARAPSSSAKRRVQPSWSGPTRHGSPAQIPPQQ
jgi:hypothetical protein